MRYIFLCFLATTFFIYSPQASSRGWGKNNQGHSVNSTTNLPRKWDISRDWSGASPYRNIGSFPKQHPQYCNRCYHVHLPSQPCNTQVYQTIIYNSY